MRLKTTISFVLGLEAHCLPPLSLLPPQSHLHFIWSPHQDFAFQGFFTEFFSTIDPNFDISLDLKFGFKRCCFKLWLLFWYCSLASNWCFMFDGFGRWGQHFMVLVRGQLLLWLCIIFWSCLIFSNCLIFWSLPLLSLLRCLILSLFGLVVTFSCVFWFPEYNQDFCTWTCPWRSLSLLGSRICLWVWSLPFQSDPYCWKERYASPGRSHP